MYFYEQKDKKKWIFLSFLLAIFYFLIVKGLVKLKRS